MWMFVVRFIQECACCVDRRSCSGLASGREVPAGLSSLGPGQMFSVGQAGKSAAKLPQ